MVFLIFLGLFFQPSLLFLSYFFLIISHYLAFPSSQRIIIVVLVNLCLFTHADFLKTTILIPFFFSDSSIFMQMGRQLEIFFKLHQLLLVFEIFDYFSLIHQRILRVYEIRSHCDDDVGANNGAYASLLLM